MQENKLQNQIRCVKKKIAQIERTQSEILLKVKAETNQYPIHLNMRKKTEFPRKKSKKIKENYKN